MIYELRDRVYDITRGWGTVISLNLGDKTYPVVVRLDETGDVESYTNCGKFHVCDVSPSLFWGEVKIENPPEKPTQLDTPTKPV